MKILLDTHAFLWWILDLPRLSIRARSAIEDKSNIILFSAAGAWEIVIKSQLGKITLPDASDVFIIEQMIVNAFEPLAISIEHVIQLRALPVHHRDPFDRIMIAQCQAENLLFLTSDPLIKQYSVNTLW